MTSEIIKIKKSVVQSDDIISQQYHTYTPYTPTFNNNDEIRITIQSQDLYVLPSDSYLLIEVALARRDNVPIGGQEATFAYNFIAHLFSELRYELNGIEIDRCKMPGITSLMKMLIACKEEDKYALTLFTLNAGANFGTGTFNMIVPLRFLFGFCDDYNKIIMNSKHELILVRSRTDFNMYVADSDIQFTVNKIHWKVPHVALSDESKLMMLKTMNQKTNVPLAFRSWDLYELPVVPQTTRHTWSVKTTTQVTKPRYVIVGFQTNRNIRNSDASLFDHCNISNIKLYLNNERYPYDDLNLNFDVSNYHELFHNVTKIQSSYYNGACGNSPLNLSFGDFINRPVFVFDCTRTDDRVKPGMVDVRLEIEARQNIPANTSAFCLIIHDNIIRYSPFSSAVYREI